ncbi:MAG TPA: energy transducer TonB [Ohtaekwangia sp.]|uniref:energy transducer TonB n=1 Tax=Ohtaekwangia sp. TaxID=2066019 RepID=UPI002F93B4B8
MKTETAAAKNWDDLVFENRNKLYGAYEMRKSYSGNLATGFSFSIGLAVVAIAIPILSALMKDDVAILPSNPFKEKVLIIDPQPIIEPIYVAPPPAAAMQTVSNNTRIRVTTTAPPNETIPINEDLQLTSSPGTEPGNGIDTSIPGEGQVPASIPMEVPASSNEPFITAEVMPAFEGGMEAMYQFIKRKIKYPGSARRLGIQGTVFVTFVVNSEGKVTNVKTIKGISAECDKEAERVIGMLPNWKPGMQNHSPVSVRMTVPIKFQMQE